MDCNTFGENLTNYVFFKADLNPSIVSGMDEHRVQCNYCWGKFEKKLKVSIALEQKSKDKKQNKKGSFDNIFK